MIRIIVCLKLVIDPEVPFSAFDIDREAMKPIPPRGMPPVINPFDENALEAALRIKDEQDCHITVISLKETVPKPLLQKVLAVGADEAIALEDPEFSDLDPFSTAKALANAIKKTGDFDMVFTGRQAADWDAGLVWAGIAEALDLPSITIAKSAKMRDRRLIVDRVVADGVEVLETDLPALISFSNEVGALRPLSIRDLVKVRKKEIPKWSKLDIGLEHVNPLEMKDLFIPELGLVDCQFIEGDTPQQKGRQLARKLIDEVGI